MEVRTPRHFDCDELRKFSKIFGGGFGLCDVSEWHHHYSIAIGKYLYSGENKGIEYKTNCNSMSDDQV